MDLNCALGADRVTTYTSCATCNGELVVEREGQITHAGCRLPDRAQADVLLEKFAALVAKIAAPDYRPNQHDELNLTALQNRIDQLDSAPPHLAAAALWYVERYRWPVFPLRPRTKVPATPHGFKDATLDVDRIRRYWTAVPDANIGIPTGIAFDVIDVDQPDGPAQWAVMRDVAGAPDIHGQASTANGGIHVLIRPTGRGNGARIRPGIDYRGAGGYIVAPPSWLGERRRSWSWVVKPGPQIMGGAA
ncbi:MAG: hypothetical protein CK431_10190 [Mycobacterium sp.]|nr:MAG: hypothetical protein CK431_10190 [Mycobacterium sp.]